MTRQPLNCSLGFMSCPSVTHSPCIPQSGLFTSLPLHLPSGLCCLLHLTSYRSMGSNALATWAILLFLTHSTISHPRGFVFVVPPPQNILLPIFTWLPPSYHPGLISNVTLQFKVGSPFMYQFQSLRNLHISKSHTKQVENKEKCQLEIIQSSSTVQWINCGIFIQWDSTAEGQGMNNNDGISMVGPQVMTMNEEKEVTEECMWCWANLHNLRIYCVGM